MKPTKRPQQQGQALVLLLVIMVVAITVISAAVIVTLVNSQGTARQVQGQYAFDIAETGVENALLRLLRDPDFPGETIFVNGGETISTVSGSPAQTIAAHGKLGNFTRIIQVGITYNNNVLNIISWKEIAP